MDDASSLFNRPDFQFFRERKISLPDRMAKPSFGNVEPIADRTDITRLMQMATSIKTKATQLLERMDEAFSSVCVPVPPHAYEVRAALERLGYDKSKICYPLFRKATDALMEDARIEDPGGILDKVTGHVLTDYHMDKKKGGEKLNEFGEQMIHFLILYTLQKMIQGFSQQDNAMLFGQTEAAPSVPGVTIGQIVAGMAVMAMVDGGLEQTVDAMKEGVKLGDFVEGDLGRVLNDPKEGIKDVANGDYLSSTMAQSYRKSDFSMCLDYYTNTIAQNEHPESLLSNDVKGIMEDCDNVVREGQRWMDSADTLRGMPHDIYKLLFSNMDVDNARLDEILAVLDDHYTRDLVCCLLIFMAKGQIDLKFVNIAQFALSIAGNGITINLAGINKAVNVMNSMLEKQIKLPLLSMIRQLFSGIFSQILEFLNTDDEEWRKVFICTPIDEMIEYIIEAIEHLEDLVIHLFEALWNDIELKNVGLKQKIQLIAGNKRAKQLSKLLGSALKAIKAGDLCAEEFRSEEEEARTQGLIDRLVSTKFNGAGLVRPELPEGVTAEQAGIDPYSMFNPVALETHNGFVISNKKTSTDNAETFHMGDCQKKLVGENAEKFHEFVNFITRETQHGSNG